jgi:hypothetical protein
VKEAWETTVHNCRQASQTAAAAAAAADLFLVVVVVGVGVGGLGVVVDLILGCPLPWATETEDRGREGMIQRPLISRVRMQVVCEMGLEATQGWTSCDHNILAS